MSVNKNQVNKELQLRGNFFQGPNEIWELPISLIAKSIWCYILSRSPEWNSSYNNLARNLDLDERTVAKHIATLEAANMLIVTKQANNAAGFELLPPSKWVASSGTASHVAPGSKNAAPHSMQLSTAKNAVQAPHEMGHTKEETLNTSLVVLNESLSKEENSNTPSPDLTKPTQPTKNPAGSKPAFLTVVDSWVAKLQPTGERKMDYISGNRMNDSIQILVDRCKSLGLPQQELSSEVLVQAVFGDRPSSKIFHWTRNVAKSFDRKVKVVYEGVTIEVPTIEESFKQMLSEEEMMRAYAKQMLSEEEMMRAYAKQFPVLDTSFLNNDDEEI